MAAFVSKFLRFFQRQSREVLTLPLRMGRIVFITVRFAALIWIIDPLNRRRAGETVPEKPVRLREYFEMVGGSFIKLGQMLALQPDIIPLAYCDELFDLMDRVRPFEFKTAEEIVLEEFGRPIEAVFDSFDKEPIATASIAQVYTATLQGNRVAVKIQRPAAESEMAPDIRIAGMLVEVIRFVRFKPLYWLIEPISEFIRWSWEELDCRHEARYTRQAYENARGEAFEKVPKVYSDYTTRRVAIFEFLHGITVLDFMRLRARYGQAPLGFRAVGYRSHDYCAHIIDNFLDGAFNRGLFHADLHPANLIILDHNVVGYIDYGITGVLGEYSRKNLVALTLAYASGDVKKMCEIFLRVSTTSPDSDVEALDRGLRRCTNRWYGSGVGGSASRASVTAVMIDWLQLSRAAKIWPQRDVIRYIRCAVALDGLIKRLDPTFDVGAALARASRRHLEAGLRRQMFSYERLFRTFSDAADLLSSGPGAIRSLFSEFAEASAMGPSRR